MAVWRDGVLIPAEEAVVPMLSHAVQRGSTVFDVLRVVPTTNGPAVLGLRPHMARFGRSMELMGMEHPFALHELEEAVLATLAANPAAPIVKVVATWSEPSLGALPTSTRPDVWIAALDADSGPGPAPSEGLRIRSADGPKTPIDVLPPNLKVAAAYTPGIRERMRAKADGFDDVVFRDSEGGLAEGTTQSVFVVKDGSVLLPPLVAVLDGITRRFVLDLAHEQGVHSFVRGVHWDEVEDADELFMCSTNFPVSPIRQLDDRDYPAPGAVAAELARGVDEVFSGSHPLAAKWLTPIGDAGQQG